jgi:hypothetical protein
LVATEILHDLLKLHILDARAMNNGNLLSFQAEIPGEILFEELEVSKC